MTAHKESQHPGHAGPFFVVEDVGSVQVLHPLSLLLLPAQVEDIVIPVQEVEDGGVEISVGVESIMEDVTIA